MPLCATDCRPCFVQLGFLPIAQQLGHKYALTVDGNTASTRLAMVLATEQVPFLHLAAPQQQQQQQPAELRMSKGNK
jgi:hypothetical protein